MTTRNEHDTGWKEVLDCYLKDFIEYCLPELMQAIDWSKGYESLDKELQVITRGTASGPRFLDKLFKVYLFNGNEQWILLHVEVQARKEEHFAKRMFTYAYRIYDKYQKNIISCAILTDNDKNWRPSYYQVGFGKTSLRLDYEVVKLIDYRDQYDALEQSTNPFASVILVELETMACQNQPDKKRQQVKTRLTNRLFKKGYSPADIAKLFRFIDWLIRLPELNELEYLTEVYELEGVNKMAYVTSIERLQDKLIEHLVARAEARAEERAEARIRAEVAAARAEGEVARVEGCKQTKQLMAKRLLSMDQSIAFIVAVTGLAADEVQALQAEAAL